MLNNVYAQAGQEQCLCWRNPLLDLLQHSHTFTAGLKAEIPRAAALGNCHLLPLVAWQLYLVLD